jgi:hypothetical protein
MAPFKKRGTDGLFGGKEGWGVLFLTGVENTVYVPMMSLVIVPTVSNSTHSQGSKSVITPQYR